MMVPIKKFPRDQKGLINNLRILYPSKPLFILIKKSKIKKIKLIKRSSKLFLFFNNFLLDSYGLWSIAESLEYSGSLTLAYILHYVFKEVEISPRKISTSSDSSSLFSSINSLSCVCLQGIGITENSKKSNLISVNFT